MTPDLLSIDLHSLPSPAPSGPPKKLLDHLSGDDYILRLDNTSLESFLACDRASEYRLVHSRIPHGHAALTYGQAIHAALEYLYLHGLDLTAMLAAGEKVLQKLPPSEGEWRNYNTFEAAIVGYVKRYPSEPFSVLEFNGEKLVERAFEEHIGEIEVNAELAYDHETLILREEDGIHRQSKVFVRKLHIVWTGVIDLVTEQNGRLAIMDHKTSSIVGPSYYEQFQLSQQFIGYTRVASKLLDQRVDGALLNVIIGRKPTPSGKSLEFARQYYHYADHKLAEWQDDVLTLIADFVDRLKLGYFPKKTLWCTGKFGQCPYLSVCQLEPALRPELLFSDAFTNNTWNPLHKD